MPSYIIVGPEARRLIDVCLKPIRRFWLQARAPKLSFTVHNAFPASQQGLQQNGSHYDC